MKFLTILVLLTIILIPALFADETGYASWYAGKYHGRQTASGEIFDTNKFTAAHKTLPFDTVVKVTNLENGKSTVVRINDRGPFIEGRIIDLSLAAAKDIDIVNSGVAKVKITIVEGDAGKAENYVYKIQIAAFSNLKNAQAASTKVKAAGLSPAIEKAGTIYRVVVPNIRQDNIEKSEEILKSNGFKDYLVKKEIKL